MKIVLIVRLVLGLMFLVLGLNTFLQFLKGPIPGGLAGQFLEALFQSQYALAIGVVQAIGGTLLPINRHVPLALTILGPVIVDILLYHLLLNHEELGGALTAAVFWFVLFFHYRQYFSGIFTAKASSASCGQSRAILLDGWKRRD
jgi:putative oxidoreductase